MHLDKSDVGPLVAAADLVEGKEVRDRSLQELGVQLVADVVDDDHGRPSDEGFFLRVEAKNCPAGVYVCMTGEGASKVFCRESRTEWASYAKQ